MNMLTDRIAGRLVFKCFVVLVLSSFTNPAIAADITGGNGNDILFFQGALSPDTITSTNPYSGQTISRPGPFNVNAKSYDGIGGSDVLFLTNYGDAIFIRNPLSGAQDVSNVETFFAGNGADLILLADTAYLLGNLTIDVGAEDDVVWANAGNDLIRGRDGNDILDGGPGSDTIYGGGGNGDVSGNDWIRGGVGNDMLFGEDGDDTFVFTLGDGNDEIDGGTGFNEILFGSGISLESLSLTPSADSNWFNIGFGSDGGAIHATLIDQLRFADGSMLLDPLTYVYGSAVPEAPSWMMMIAGFGLLGGALRRRNAKTSLRH